MREPKVSFLSFWKYINKLFWNNKIFQIMRFVKKTIARNAKKEYIWSNIEGFEPRFLDRWDISLLDMTYNLNVIIYLLRSKILNEEIVNFDIFIFFFLQGKILIRIKMKFII